MLHEIAYLINQLYIKKISNPRLNFTSELLLTIRNVFIFFMVLSW